MSTPRQPPSDVVANDAAEFLRQLAEKIRQNKFEDSRVYKPAAELFCQVAPASPSIGQLMFDYAKNLDQKEIDKAKAILQENLFDLLPILYPRRPSIFSQKSLCNFCIIPK